MLLLLLLFLAFLLLAGFLFTCCLGDAKATQLQADAGLGAPFDEDQDPESCPGILPRKTGHPTPSPARRLLTHDQRYFVSGFALGALCSVGGAWLILKIISI